MSSSREVPRLLATSARGGNGVSTDIGDSQEVATNGDFTALFPAGHGRKGSAPQAPRLGAPPAPRQCQPCGCGAGRRRRRVTQRWRRATGRKDGPWMLDPAPPEPQVNNTGPWAAWPAQTHHDMAQMQSSISSHLTGTKTPGERPAKTPGNARQTRKCRAFCAGRSDNAR